MKEMYFVEYNGNPVGSVAVSREGLYYRFRCLVKLEEKQICRLQCCWGNQCMDLGILIPVNNHYELDRKLPVKNFTDADCIFRITSNQTKERFIPIRQDAPFSNLQHLQNAKFSVRDNIPGIVIS